MQYAMFVYTYNANECSYLILLERRRCHSGLNRASGNLGYHVLCSEDMPQYLDDCFSSRKSHYIT